MIKTANRKKPGAKQRRKHRGADRLLVRSCCLPETTPESELVILCGRRGDDSDKIFISTTWGILAKDSAHQLCSSLHHHRLAKVKVSLSFVFSFFESWNSFSLSGGRRALPLTNDVFDVPSGTEK